MAEEEQRLEKRKLGWITPALIASLISGGFMGAVFTWWVNRKPPATIGYVISTTTTGADANVSSLVPNLSLRLGEERIPAIHTHAIELTVTKGYADRVTFGVTFGSKPRVFGRSLASPSSLHSISCADVADGMKCEIAPANPQAQFKLLIATDSPHQPGVMTVAPDVRLSPLEEIATTPFAGAWSSTPALFALVGALGGVLVSIMVLVIADTRRMKAERIALRERQELIEKFEAEMTEMSGRKVDVVTDDARLNRTNCVRSSRQFCTGVRHPSLG